MCGKRFEISHRVESGLHGFLELQKIGQMKCTSYQKSYMYFLLKGSRKLIISYPEQGGNERKIIALYGGNFLSFIKKRTKNVVKIKAKF